MFNRRYWSHVALSSGLLVSALFTVVGILFLMGGAVVVIALLAGLETQFEILWVTLFEWEAVIFCAWPGFSLVLGAKALTERLRAILDERIEAGELPESLRHIF